MGNIVERRLDMPEKPPEEVRAENTKARFSDNPFRTGKETPEHLEWRRKRDEATRIFHETGDTTMAEEIGLFPKGIGEKRKAGESRKGR